MRKNIGALLAMALAMGGGLNESMHPGNPGPNKSKTPGKSRVKKVIPKGCKEYYFNKFGDYTHGPTVEPTHVFYCIASKTENAQKKFNTWLLKNS